MKKIILKNAVFTVLALCLTTCQTLISAMDEPKVTFQSVSLSSINFKGANLLGKVRVENPNPFDIPFPEVGWKLALNSSSLINGTIKNNKKIKGKDATLVDVPLSFEFLQAFNAISSLKGKASTGYKVNLAVKFNIPVIGNKVWNLEKEGNVPLPQVPKLSTPTLRVEKSDITETAVAVSMNIQNLNTFELPAPKIDLDYKINNTSVVKSNASTAALKPNSTTPVTMRFTVKQADLAKTLGASFLSGKTSLSGNLTSSFDFKVPAFGSPTTLQTPWNLPITK